nr:ATP-dependent DNA helicase PIF1-like [Tanacetum cinerariifolium]
MLILDSDDHIGSIIHETYPYLLRNLYDPYYFQKRAILAPTHELADMINDRMLSLLPGDVRTYNSSNMVGVADVDTNFIETMYTTEFLNNLNMAGILHHSLKLKIEDVIRQDLHLDDADGVECLPNEEIFAELARMGYEKPHPKLTFYKAFFSSQWKFLIHILV